MPKNESTAITDFIQGVINKPIARDSDDDLLFRAPKSAKSAKSATVAAPAPAPVAVLARPASGSGPQPRASASVDVDETHAMTRRVERTMIHKLVANPAVIAVLAVAGVAVGIAGYRVLSSKKSAPPTSVAAAVLPVPAPTPVVTRPIVTPVPPPTTVVPVVPATPKLVDLRLESEPAGATVTIVDTGKSSVLGTTPLNASVDPAHAVDLVFTLEGHPPTLQHVDPLATQHVAVVLDSPQPVAAAAPPPPPPPAKHRHHAAAKRAAARPTAKVAAADHGTGTLMVSTKPPCEIVVDGKRTGLTSPQRAIDLSAGSHQITLINAHEHIKQTIAVKIAADQSTKLVRDLMKK